MDKKNLLFIKTKNLGDAVILTAAACVARPNANVDVLCFSDCAQVYQNAPDIARVYTLTRGARGFRSVIEHVYLIFQLLKRKRYDVVIHLSDDWRGAWLCRLIRPVASVAARTPRRPGLWHRSFREIVDVPPRTHAIDRDVSLVRHAEVELDLDRLELPSFVTDRRIRPAETFPGPYVVVQAASRWAFKQLPDRVNSSVLQQLVDRGYRVILGGGPADQPFNQSIASLGGVEVQISDSKDIGDFIRMVGSASAVITIDSFALHLAEALKIPVVAIFGPSDDLIWGPRSPRSRVVELSGQFLCRPCRRDGCDGSKQSLCLREISAEMVMLAFDDLMGIGPK